MQYRCVFDGFKPRTIEADTREHAAELMASECYRGQGEYLCVVVDGYVINVNVEVSFHAIPTERESAPAIKLPNLQEWLDGPYRGTFIAEGLVVVKATTHNVPCRSFYNPLWLDLTQDLKQEPIEIQESCWSIKEIETWFNRYLDEHPDEVAAAKNRWNKTFTKK